MSLSLFHLVLPRWQPFLNNPPELSPSLALTDEAGLTGPPTPMLTKDSRDRGRRMLADKQGAKAIAALISEAEGRTVTAKEIEALAPPKGVRNDHPPAR